MCLTMNGIVKSGNNFWVLVKPHQASTAVQLLSILRAEAKTWKPPPAAAKSRQAPSGIALWPPLQASSTVLAACMCVDGRIKGAAITAATAAWTRCSAAVEIRFGRQWPRYLQDRARTHARSTVGEVALAVLEASATDFTANFTWE